MCGGSGAAVEEEPIGGSEFQGGSEVQGGTLGRDQIREKKNKVLLKNGKIQPGTRATQQAASNERIKDYEKKLKFEDIHRTGSWNNGVRSYDPCPNEERSHLSCCSSGRKDTMSRRDLCLAFARDQNGLLGWEINNKMLGLKSDLEVIGNKTDAVVKHIDTYLKIKKARRRVLMVERQSKIVIEC